MDKIPPMGHVMAICGKGGSGKTTTSALIIRALLQARPNWRVLAVDADPAGGLHLALGMTPARSLNDLRQEVAEEAADGGADREALAAEVDYRLVELLEERGPLALLNLGRPEEQGCYCALNGLLRDSLESLTTQFELTLIDAEAGVEQVNRRVMRGVSHLLLVSDPTRKGVAVIRAIQQVAARLAGEGHMAGVLMNRVRDPEQARELAARVAAPLLARVPEDPLIREFDALGRSFLELPDTPALERIKDLLKNSAIDL